MILILLGIMNVVYSLGSQSLNVHPDAFRTTQEMAIAHGYECMNYTIATSDGYLLTIFRIFGKKHTLDDGTENPKFQKHHPIIMQHGLLDTSDSFLINEDPAFAYIFADAGYDVWLPNFRGNKYSRKHLVFDPDTSSEFWNYSVDELIAIDLRHIINFVVKTSGQEQVHYIGHSMGGGSLLAAGSEDPEFYGKHLRSVMTLSAATCLVHSQFFAHIARQFPVQFPFTTIRGEIYVSDLTHTLLGKVCRIFFPVCASVVDLLLGTGSLMKRDKIQVLVARMPDGTSEHLLMHLLQNTQVQGYFKFRRPMHGDPRVEYQLSNFPADKVPLTIVGSKKDRMVTVADTRGLRDKVNITGHLNQYLEYDEIGHMAYSLLKKGAQAVDDIFNFVNKHD